MGLAQSAITRAQKSPLDQTRALKRGRGGSLGVASGSLFVEALDPRDADRDYLDQLRAQAVPVGF